MDAQSIRLFHLHYRVPDVSHAETVLADRGLPVHRRYGQVDGGSRALRGDETPPDGFQLRLQDAQSGSANVTIAPGPGLAFDHFGVVTSDFGGTVSRALNAGWYVNEGEHRTFLHTPWRFRVEAHPLESDVATALGPPSDGRFASVTLAVPEPDPVRSGLRTVLGDVPSLSIDGSGTDHPMVTHLSLAGEVISGEPTIHASELDVGEG